MNSFIGNDLPEGFVCWTPDGMELVRSNVGDISPSENFILEAIHEPMSFKVRKHAGKFSATTSIICKSDDDYYQDRDILEVFNEVIKTENQNERKNTFLVTVKGDAGSGKSHLVRWLYENVQEQPNVRKVWVIRQEDQHLQVMRKFVDDLAELSSHESGKTTRAQDLKLRMSKTFDLAKSNPEELANDLFEAVSSVLKYQSDRFLNKPEPEKSTRKWLIFKEEGSEKNKLSDLLRWRKFDDGKRTDGLCALFKDVVVGLLGSDGAVSMEARNSHLKIEVPFVDRLLKQYQKDFLKTDRSNSGKDFGDLINSLITHVEIVTDLLNEALEFALAKVTHLGQADFKVVFAEVREEMARLGQQLLIFLEDFSGVSTGVRGLSGFQADLLSVFTDVGTESRAPLRVVMAMTPSLWDQLPENVIDRHEFTIDVGHRVENINTVSFLSRYLNISRSSFEDVESAFNKRSSEDLTSQKWVPNACIKCLHREDCHKTFGAKNGVGLYPLNENVGELLAKHITDGKVVTNRVLVDKLRRLLNSYRQITGGTFPEKNVADLIVGSETETAVAIAKTNFATPRRDEKEYKQLARYVQIWNSGASLPSGTERRVFNLKDYGELLDSNAIHVQNLTSESGGTKTEPGNEVINRLNEFELVALYANRDQNLPNPPTLTNDTRVRLKKEIFSNVELNMRPVLVSLEKYRKLLGIKFSVGNFSISGFGDVVVAEKPLSPVFVIPGGEFGKYVLWGALLNDKDVKNLQLTPHDIAQSRVCFSEYVLEIVGKLTKLWVDSIFEDGGPISSIAKVLKLVYLLAVDEFEGDQLDLISNWFRNDQLLQKWVAKVGEVEPEIGTLLKDFGQLTDDLRPIIGLSNLASGQNGLVNDENLDGKFMFLSQINEVISHLSESPSCLLEELFTLGPNAGRKSNSMTLEDDDPLWRKTIQEHLSVLNKTKSEHLNQWHAELTGIVRDLEILFSVSVKKDQSEMQTVVQKLLNIGMTQESRDVLELAVTSIIEISSQGTSILENLKLTQESGPHADAYLRSLLSVSKAKTDHRNITRLARRLSETSEFLTNKSVGDLVLEDVVDLDNVSSVEKVKGFSC